MIEQHLDESIEILDKLISLTREDLANIKAAKHDGIDESVKQKNQLIKEFKDARERFHNTLFSLSDGGKRDFAEILSEEDKEKLGEFKEKFQTLRKENKEYARLVLVVKNYFDGLVNTLFDEDSGTDNAYKNAKTNINSLFKMNV